MPPETDDFVRAIVRRDLESGLHQGVVTRFPPEPNGYLHIGHAKAVCLNFGVAQDFGGRCHLRFDDTNPAKEDPEFVESIQRDLRWLGFDWGEHLYFASDYFERLYAYAEQLIRQGDAYVCSQSEEDMRRDRGTVTEAGTPSPYRDRTADESLDLLRRMRAGEFADGAHVVRAKIDMANPNMKMRDPPFYRIRHVHHDRTGDTWCIYPLYDYAHCLSDAVERITHSVCTLEFENNRELYDWFVEKVGIPAPVPRQYEFARLSLTYNIMSKRKLLRLVQEGRVDGWDDPRMPTLAGMRRRGYTAEAIRAFCERIGVAKTNSTVEMEVLEAAVRDDLGPRCDRTMAVLRPLRVEITNLPAGATETFEVPASPPGVEPARTRSATLSRVVWIEREDFAEDPPVGFKRLAPGREVRLRGACFVRCESVERGADGEIASLRCTWDPATRGGDAPDGRRPSATLHWISDADARPATVRVFDRLFASESPESGPEGTTFLDHLNPRSLEVIAGALVDSVAAAADVGTRLQFERLGYFVVAQDSTADAPVFGRILPLRDSWAKATKPGKTSKGAGKPSSAASTNAPTPTAPAVDPVAAQPALAALRDAAVRAGADADAASKWIANDLLGELHGGDPASLPFGGAEIASLLALQAAGDVSGKAARKVLRAMLERGGDPAALLDELGLRQVSDAGALAPVVAGVIAEHPDEAARFRGGEKKLMGFFMGRIMRASGGSADPKAVSRLLREQLGG